MKQGCKDYFSEAVSKRASVLRRRCNIKSTPYQGIKESIGELLVSSSRLGFDLPLMETAEALEEGAIT